MRKEKVTVQSAPFVKPHCVLIVAAATVLLINGRSPHTDVRSQKHAGMFSASRTLYGGTVEKYNGERVCLILEWKRFWRYAGI